MPSGEEGNGVSQQALLIDGPVRLQGTVRVSGSKNATLPLLAATLLTTEPLRLVGVPRLSDVQAMCALLTALGVKIEHGPGDALTTRFAEDSQTSRPVPAEIVRSMRAGICVLGPLLATIGHARLPLPGGCAIGTRPIDLHLAGLRALGATFRRQGDCIVGHASRLKGAEIDLRGPNGPTVTGTANVMMAATRARGTTIIRHAAREPEIVALGRCLQGMGARIDGLGTDLLRIEGVPGLRGTTYHVPPDRIEAATWLLAVAATGGRLHIENVAVGELEPLIRFLRRYAEADLAIGSAPLDTAPRTAASPHAAGFAAAARRKAASDSTAAPPARVIVCATARVRPFEAIIEPHPGLPTDVQAQLMTLAARAEGRSHIVETVFPQRFAHVAALRRFGIAIRRRGAHAWIEGPARFRHADVRATDLRAGAALVIAALCAEGPSIVRGLDHLNRGYERLVEKLQRLGASARHVPATELPAA